MAKTETETLLSLEDLVLKLDGILEGFDLFH